MSKKRPVIITCAVTGAIHTPSMSPHLPITAQQIAEAAIGAAQAGAAIVHLHARDPNDGRPSQDPALFAEFLPQIKAASDVVINITTGGAPNMTVEERLQPVLQFKPELASLNMGSMNFGLYEMLNRFTEFKHDWERPYLEESDDRIFRNTFRDIAHILNACADNRTRFEIECYDIYHMQIMEGDLARTLQTHLPQINHIQLADNPGRHEPGTGEINYRFLFEHLDRIGYQGWVGCEYKPLTSTEAGLGWLKTHNAV